MRIFGGRGAGLAVFLAVLAAALSPAAARADSSDPLFLFVPKPPLGSEGAPTLPPTGYLDGPCGLAVDSAHNFYVSDYYHGVVDVFSSERTYKAQLTGVDPLDGPCQVALDAGNGLYVNDYHRSAIRYGSSPSFGTGTEITGAQLDGAHPTGVAVSAETGDVYVDDGTYVARYEAPVTPGEEPVAKIGLGTLGEGYGLAVSGNLSTAGYVYVADAADDTVKVYDPAVDAVNPVQTIDGAATPAGDFVSLRDSAIAVDRVTGEVYVVDDLQPALTEEPQATVHVFSLGGVYEGHLEHNVIDARPVGLAVDNASGFNQGRVYVTTGNSNEAGVYAYPQHAATNTAPVPPSLPLTAFSAGAPGSPLPAALAAGPTAATGPSAPVATTSDIVQKGKVRIDVDGSLAPRTLPRTGSAPISVSVGWNVSTIDGSPPPQLRRLQIAINRHGRLDATGLPTCPYDRIQPASSVRALANCRSTLVGRGTFSTEVGLAGQEGYVTHGPLLVFNGRSHGRPVLFAQIYSARPFPTSFVIPFEERKIGHGTFGTELDAAMPPALSNWGNLVGVEMTLGRRYRSHGVRHSFLSAGCPAPNGFSTAVFPLARTSFDFPEGKALRSVLTRSCRARAS